MAQANDAEKPSQADAIRQRQERMRTYVFVIVGVVIVGVVAMLVSLASGPRSAYDGILQVHNASDGAPVLGDWQNAPVRLTVFLDFTDISSARLHKTLLQLVDPYIRTGKAILIEYLTPMFGGSGSLLAAEAAYCASEQNAYWQMHDALFNLWERQFEAYGRVQAPAPAYTNAEIVLAAQQIQIDPQEVSACISEGRQRDTLEASIDIANRVGITTIPAVYVNGEPITDEDGRPIAEPTLAQLEATIESALASATAEQ
ncbi:MAG: DsbA family protein [Anaerolineae bacterium]|nr:DsbA family protein [Anaerolineae bacterium]